MIKRFRLNGVSRLYSGAVRRIAHSDWPVNMISLIKLTDVPYELIEH